MDQPTFADLEYESKKRKTRREIFLERMDALIPWEQMEERIRPFYPKAGRGRRPYELSAMVRIHCVQLFYNLSDPGMEDMLYEVESVRRFVGLKLSGPLPDETTILNFRHLLEEHELGQSLFEEINRHSAPRDRVSLGIDCRNAAELHFMSGVPGTAVIWSPRDCGFGRGRSWTRAS